MNDDTQQAAFKIFVVFIGLFLIAVGVLGMLERNAPIGNEINESDGEQDELFLNAVLIVVESQHC